MKIELDKEHGSEYVLGIALCYLPDDKSIVIAIGIFKHTFSITIKINSK
jgi:hypothetical protein